MAFVKKNHFLFWTAFSLMTQILEKEHKEDMQFYILEQIPNMASCQLQAL